MGIGEKLKDRRGKAVMKWHRRGKHVQVSTALPLRKSEKMTKHAREVGWALFGKENLADLRSIPTEKLPALAAQVRARSYITDHFLAEALGEVLTENERLEEENEKLKEEIKKLKEANAVRFYLTVFAVSLNLTPKFTLSFPLQKTYDPENPAFLNEIAVHPREGGEDMLDILRERQAFKAEHANVFFDELFPAFQEVEAAQDEAAMAVRRNLCRGC
ncbi:hypothetical protein KSP40_PGU001309 [Platanthera guangdongensis]|uniref:Uncharacterized protein n=1 Tax=Platanthera guangdongensis TaxID=2320717 RepID=A0ABR2M1Q1_9ASPA